MTEHIPAIIRAEMERQKITYASIRDASGLRISTINEVIRGAGRPRIDTILGILKGLGKSLAWLEQEMKAAAKREPVVESV